MSATGSHSVDSRRNRDNRSRHLRSCLPCHQAKRKCNRKKPCSQCLKSQITASCVYESIPESDLEALQNIQGQEGENEILRSRVADLEALVSELRSGYRGTHRSAAKRRKLKDENGSESNNEDKAGVYYGRSLYLGGPAAPDLLQRLMPLVPNDTSDMLFAFYGGYNISQPATSTNSYIFPTIFPASAGIKEMLGLLHGIGRDTADGLLDAFYELVDPLYHYVATPWLNQRYVKCWASDDKIPLPQEAALVFVVLGLGDLVVSNTHSWLFISASVQLLRISNFLANPSMDTIHTLCFVAVYLQHEGKLNEYWPLLGLVIRLAQSMALHRDPSTLGLPPEEGELRRRLFWTIAAQETALSVMFGRPHGIGQMDCHLPADVSDSELCGEKKNLASRANEISYNRYTWQLSEIIREMLQGSFKRSEAERMGRVREIEIRIRDWYSSLPSRFRFNSTVPQPRVYPNFESKKAYVQSLLLYIIVNHTLLVLYRMPLLSCYKSTTAISPHLGAKRTCFEAAFAVADGWKVLQDSFPKMAKLTWMHWFRAFHASLICLVAIRADGQDSEFRGPALSSWNSSLRIFSRLRDQNNSILGCHRALSRLDTVLKKELEIEPKSRRFSSHKPLVDSSYQILFSPAPPKAKEVNPFSPTVQVSSAIPQSTTTEAELLTPISNTTLQAMDNGTFVDRALDIFDMDTGNWPSWLTDQQTPE